MSFAGALLVAARGCAFPVSYRKHGSANGNRMRLPPMQLVAVGCMSLQVRAVRFVSPAKKPLQTADVVTRLSLLRIFHLSRTRPACSYVGPGTLAGLSSILLVRALFESPRRTLLRKANGEFSRRGFLRSVNQQGKFRICVCRKNSAGWFAIASPAGHLADVKLNQKALEKLARIGQAAPRFRADNAAAFLKSLVGREKLADFGIQPSIILVLVSAPPALMAIFTAPSIGSLEGTSIRSTPCS